MTVKQWTLCDIDIERMSLIQVFEQCTNVFEVKGFYVSLVLHSIENKFISKTEIHIYHTTKCLSDFEFSPRKVKK